MASILFHPVVPLTLGYVANRADVPWRLIVIGMICAILPDFDVIGFKFHIDYHSTFGHRGFTHSVLFAAIIAAFGFLAAPTLKLKPLATAVFIFIATLSHGLIDALTNGGLGVAFFAPFSNERYFFPWQVIEVSPIGIRNFLSERGLTVLNSELIWIGLPCLFVALTTYIYRQTKSNQHD
ncbi:MAG: metal-dependent hydrolase [Burkholderiales bacterium]|nr:metal-dependent hydrolase [Burkholderiales bacterium]